MGLCYYGFCDDHREQIDLDKFYSWSAFSVETYAGIDRENLDEYKTDGWIYRSLRLHAFINKHNGCRVGVMTEHDDRHESYAEVMPWPHSGSGTTDVIDWTDPKGSRLIIQTPLGDIYLDKLPAGINCFRDSDDGRVDTLLLRDGTK